MTAEDSTADSAPESASSESSFSAFSEVSSIGCHSGVAAKISDVPDNKIEPDALKHAKYFMKDGNVKFKVQNTLFRVHRFFFVRDSEYFHAMLGGGGSDDDDEKDWVRPAGSGAQPICLDDEGVTSVEFERFLDILYPSDFGKHSLSTLDQWTSVLHLASKWGFTTMRALAVREVLPLASPVDRIVLGRSYDISQWLPSAYVDVCARPEALTSEEGRRLGIDDVVKISALRQAVRPYKGAVLVEEIERGVHQSILSGVAAGPEVNVIQDRSLDTPSEAAEMGKDPVSTPSSIKPCSEALQLTFEMIDSYSLNGDFSNGLIEGSLVLPHIAAQASKLDSPALRALVHYIVDAAENTKSLSECASICVYLTEHIDSTLPNLGIDGKDLLVSGKWLFTRCLMDYCMATETGSAIEGAAHLTLVPRIRAVQLLSAIWSGVLPQEVMSRCLPLIVARMDDGNAEHVCDVLDVVLARYSAYNPASSPMKEPLGALVDDAVAKTSRSHWRIACRGTALMNHWVSRR